MSNHQDQPSASDAAAHLHISSDETAERFQEKLKEIELKEKERLTQVRADELGLGYINLRGFPIEPETLLLIPPDVSQELHMVSFFHAGREIRVGAVDPESPAVIDRIEQLGSDNNAHVELYLISVYSYTWAQKLYANIVAPKHVVAGVEIARESLEKYRSELKTLQDLHDRIKKVPTTEVVTMILAGALKTEASDIHIEAEENDIKLRYRIDGVLQTIAVLARESWPKIVNRIKLLSGLKINIDNQPQDGRITIYTSDDKIDVRVSTLPSAYGESVVMRLLMSATTGLAFEHLGVRGKAYEELERQLKRPNGMIITTGPTSSGKTTTLYSFLNRLNTPERKIVTLEDPIEYRIPGINQSQIDHFRQYTFSKGLKAILRQNPDVVMVGEIRDNETAEIAIHASLTGHLVLSSLHTNNAAGAVPRFLAMGIKPFLLTPALNAVIAQRLVRRICDKCKEKVELTPAVRKQVKDVLGAISPASGEKVDLDNLHFYKGKGCPVCHGIGLKGRIGIFEVFTMTPEIEKIVLSEQISEHVMQDIAVKNGMVLMVQDGLLKALEGVTTVDEVFRVAQ
ncbi:MAG: type II/IV secretion system protein [Candidatus Kerfeldbacteria bacterium]|nr:type II/IV secretion system protein [Candidatus Kerfeldbacteria bacterium]